MLISLFGKHNEIRIINKHKFTPSFLIYFKPNIKVIFNGITDTKNNFCEANFITDNGVYSFEAAGCRYTFQKFKKNIFYNNYYQISNHQKILKEKELNIFGNISKKIYQNIILKSKNNISNFETGIEVTNILNYIKKRI